MIGYTRKAFGRSNGRWFKDSRAGLGIASRGNHSAFGGNAKMPTESRDESLGRLLQPRSLRGPVRPELTSRVNFDSIDQKSVSGGIDVESIVALGRD